MTYNRTIPLAFLTLSLGACASTQMRYYTLTPPLSGPDTPAPPCCKVQIRRVAVPSEVDRAEIVTRNGLDQVVVHGNDAWLAPLADGIRSALGDEVNRYLSSEAPVRDFAVWVNITRFESVVAQYVVVAADWRLRVSATSQPTFVICATTIRINILDGMPALVQGYQQALVQIADDIALGLKNADGHAMPHCSAG